MKRIENCVSGRDYYQYAQEHDLEVKKNGSYYEIYDERGLFVARVPNSARCLPKETRRVINEALMKAGLVIAIAMVLIWML